MTASVHWETKGRQYQIWRGSVFDCLKNIPDGLVQCCVTSPPYWGLRDYGTGKWEGGRLDCDHKPTTRQGKTGDRADRGNVNEINGVFCDTCRKCGAVRIDDQIGVEPTSELFVKKIVEVFREVRRVLHPSGTLWLNLGDSYSRASDGLKSKDLCLIPWRVVIALQADGWYARSIIAWSKKSPMPESVTDRPTNSWEPIFLLSRSSRYFYDAESLKVPSKYPPGSRPDAPKGSFSSKYANGGREGDESFRAIRSASNIRSMWLRPDEIQSDDDIWHLGPEPVADAHFACFPSEIPRRAIKAGTSEKGRCPKCGSPWQRITEKIQLRRERPNAYTKRIGADGTGNSCANDVAGVEVRTVGWEPGCDCGAGDPVPCVVLDPFLGSGTAMIAAVELGRAAVGCDLNAGYCDLATKRVSGTLRTKPGGFAIIPETKKKTGFVV